MVDNKLNNSLINPLPPIILIITLILILIELIFQLSEANLMFGESGQVLRNNIIMEKHRNNNKKKTPLKKAFL